MRTLARGLDQLVTALRQVDRGTRRAAKAELLKALRTIAAAERLRLKADRELGLRRGA